MTKNKKKMKKMKKKETTKKGKIKNIYWFKRCKKKKERE